MGALLNFHPSVRNTKIYRYTRYLSHQRRHVHWIGLSTIMNAAITFMPPAALAFFNSAYAASQSQDFFFWLLVGFRYVRLIVHIVTYFFIYRPTPVLAEPSYSRADCTVIVPTVDPLNEDFNECLHSILMNSPAAVIIVTVGKDNKRTCKSVIKNFQLTYPAIKLTVLTTEIASKRRQVCAATPYVRTKVTVLADDHVFWPSINFLPTVVAPFEDAQVGCVGTSKKVRREPTGLSFRSFFNFLGCVYLERHNFELAATNAIDGGVFVVSGRTSVIRTSIIQDPAFMDGFTNEMFFFGKFGPLNADDDNFITRWLVTNNWKIKFQHCADATIETTLGTYPKFLSQCLRWVRTTWRSNSASLFTDRTVWLSQPWCVYAVYITSFFNFALFYDAAMVFAFYYHTSFGNSENALYVMAAIIFASKMVKLIPHFLRCPADILFVPGYIAFAYYHSLLKLYALFTFYVTAWGGRNLATVGTEAETESTSSADDDSCAQPRAYFDYPIYSPGLRQNTSHDDVSSYASSSSWSGSSSPRMPSSRSSIRTPWGQVRRNNPIYQPANVLESQSPLSLNSRKGKKSSSSASSRTDSDSCSMSVSSGSSPGSWNPSPLFGEEEMSPPSSPDLVRLAAEAEAAAAQPSESSNSSWTWDNSSPSRSAYAESSPASSVVEYPKWGTASYQAPYAESLDSSSGASTLSTSNSCAGKQLQRELDAHVVGSTIKAAPEPRIRVSPESPSRNWTRGVDCGRQHDGDCMLDYRGRCQIGDVRSVQWAGR